MGWSYNSAHNHHYPLLGSPSKMAQQKEQVSSPLKQTQLFALECLPFLTNKTGSFPRLQTL